ncbi:hypothetical protein V6N11_065429 [Hibiscus sabdariffa]|uniref:Uncharacterized protein n=1 Tax=Hibiscus sabdariffa TaxID=183260 RepID=A0ABR2ABH9_9ROSI
MVRQGEALNDNRVQIQGSRYGVLDQVIPETQVEGDDRHGYSNLVEQVASKILPAMSSPTARNGQDIAGSSDMSKVEGYNPNVVNHMPRTSRGSHAAIRIVENDRDNLMTSRNEHVRSGDTRNNSVALSRKGVRMKNVGSIGRTKRGVVD